MAITNSSVQDGKVTARVAVYIYLTGNRVMKKFCSALVLATLGVTGIAQAESHASAEDLTKAVKARQATMQLYAFNLGILGNMAKGSMDYNADVATEAAGNLVKLSSQNQMA